MINFIESIFCIYRDDHTVFILQFVNVVYHMGWFANIEKSLHSCGMIPTFGHGIGPFKCIAWFGLLVFCWDFCIYVRQWYWPVIFSFFVVSLSSFGIRVMVVLQSKFGSILSSVIFWNSFKRIAVNHSLNIP